MGNWFGKRHKAAEIKALFVGILLSEIEGSAACITLK